MGTEANDGYTSWIFGSIFRCASFSRIINKTICQEHIRHSQAWIWMNPPMAARRQLRPRVAGTYSAMVNIVE